MTRQELERSLDILAALHDPTRLRLYRYVERQPAAVSRDEAADEVGVSRALAAFHLDKLVAVGLLATEYRRLSGRSGPGAGRTSKLYRRSAHQFELTLPERRYDLLARLLAEAADSTESGHGAGAARELGRSLGSRARGRLRGSRSPTRVLGCVEDIAAELGFDPYRDASGDVRLRNCPFDPLSRNHTTVVCGITEAILTGVVEGLGTDALSVSREMRPERCCGIVHALPPTERKTA